MKWYPAQAKKGDMIRIHLGGICHYGIFVSEEEVIQFGLPPLPQYRTEGTEITVCTSDIDVFSCGQTVEVAVPEFRERLKRRSAEKTVRLARSRLGEGGYNLLHNNCEHFVYECAYGISLCTQEESARRRWNSRPILDVYLAPYGQEDIGTVTPPAREKYIRAAKDDTLRLQRHAVWKLLEIAAEKSFDEKLSDLRLRRSRSGKWTCDRLQFSLAHTDGAVAAAVSNGTVGIDIEDTNGFLRKFSDEAALAAMRDQILTEQERSETEATAEALLPLWTKKQCLYKCKGDGSFDPRTVNTLPNQTRTRRLKEPALCISVCGNHLANVRYYLVTDGKAKLLLSGAFLDENETV